MAITRCRQRSVSYAGSIDGGIRRRRGYRCLDRRNVSCQGGSRAIKSILIPGQPVPAQLPARNSPLRGCRAHIYVPRSRIRQTQVGNVSSLATSVGSGPRPDGLTSQRVFHPCKGAHVAPRSAIAGVRDLAARHHTFRADALEAASQPSGSSIPSQRCDASLYGRGSLYSVFASIRRVSSPVACGFDLPSPNARAHNVAARFYPSNSSGTLALLTLHCV